MIGWGLAVGHPRRPDCTTAGTPCFILEGPGRSLGRDCYDRVSSMDRRRKESVRSMKLDLAHDGVARVIKEIKRSAGDPSNAPPTLNDSDGSRIYSDEAHTVPLVCASYQS